MVKIFTVFCVASFCLISSISANSNDFLTNTWKEINNKNFAGAQSILFDHLQSYPTDSQSQFLYAQTLAWDGKYSDALNTLDALLEKYPKNSDYLLTKARILSWQNKNVEAIAILDQARDLSPDYFDIWQLQLTLLKRQYTASDQVLIKNYYLKFTQQFSNKEIPPLNLPSPKKNRFILSSASYEILDNNSENWKGISISYGSYWKKYRYIAKLDSTNRFDLNDQQLGVAIYLKKKSNIWLDGGFTTSSQHSLFPSYSIYGKIDYLMPQSWLGSYQLNHKKYKSSTVDSNSFALSKRWGNFEPRLLLSVSTIDYNDITFMTSAQMTYFFKNKHTIRFSISKGQELENINERSILYDISNITIDGKFIINSTWHFIYAMSHHIQGTAYTKNGILSGLQFRF